MYYACADAIFIWISRTLRKMEISQYSIRRAYFGLRFITKHKDYEWAENFFPVSKYISKFIGLYEFTFSIRFFPIENIDLITDLDMNIIITQIEIDLSLGKIICEKYTNYQILSHLLAYRNFSESQKESVLDSHNFSTIPHQKLELLRTEYNKVQNIKPRQIFLQLIELMRTNDCYGCEIYPFDDSNFYADFIKNKSFKSKLSSGSVVQSSNTSSSTSAINSLNSKRSLIVESKLYTDVFPTDIIEDITIKKSSTFCNYRKLPTNSCYIDEHVKEKSQTKREALSVSSTPVENLINSHDMELDSKLHNIEGKTNFSSLNCIASHVSKYYHSFSSIKLGFFILIIAIISFFTLLTIK
ncbi:hypothetical protein HZS_4442 [Henneguya salminicola]|nr:hypothetical protein HZS_4442 [Henneguya salminicola]